MVNAVKSADRSIARRAQREPLHPPQSGRQVGLDKQCLLIEVHLPLNGVLGSTLPPQRCYDASATCAEEGRLSCPPSRQKERRDEGVIRTDNNLPLQLTGLVGRQREIKEVGRLLAEARLLTLTGSGGSGKTRLALAVATEVVEDYGDGAWLVELAPLSDPELVPEAVASVLGVREAPGSPLLGTLAEH